MAMGDWALHGGKCNLGRAREEVAKRCNQREELTRKVTAASCLSDGVGARAVVRRRGVIRRRAAPRLGALRGGGALCAKKKGGEKEDDGECEKGKIGPHLFCL